MNPIFILAKKQLSEQLRQDQGLQATLPNPKQFPQIQNTDSWPTPFGTAWLATCDRLSTSIVVSKLHTHFYSLRFIAKSWPNHTRIADMLTDFISKW